MQITRKYAWNVIQQGHDRKGMQRPEGDNPVIFQCYAGNYYATRGYGDRELTFKEVEDDAAMYPEFRQTEFRHAAYSIVKLKICEYNAFQSLTCLEDESRALSEAYINMADMSTISIDNDTQLDFEANATKEITCKNLLQNCPQLDYKLYVGVTNRL